MQRFDVRYDGGEIACDVFGVEHAADHIGGPLGQAREAFGKRCATGGVVAAIKPKLGFGGGINQRAFGEFLHPSGPSCACDCRLITAFRQAEVTQACEGGASVLELVCAHQRGRRKIKQASLVLIDKAAALFRNMPMLALGNQRRAKACGLGFDHLCGVFGLCRKDKRHATFDDPCFFRGDLGDGVTQELRMIKRDGGNHCEGGFFDDVGGVKTPAETDFEQRIVGRRARHGKEASDSCDLEIGDRVAIVGIVAFVQNLSEMRLGNQLACEADALVKAGKVRRGIGVCL